MHVRQPAFDAVVVERQSFVVEAQQVQNRRVKVVDGRDVFDRSMAEFVGGAVAERLSSRRRPPANGEALRVVIAAVRSLLERRHSAKFRDQTTSVSSSNPRAFRSRIRAASG